MKALRCVSPSRWSDATRPVEERQEGRGEEQLFGELEEDCAEEEDCSNNLAIVLGACEESVRGLSRAGVSLKSCWLVGWLWFVGLLVG